MYIVYFGKICVKCDLLRQLEAFKWQFSGNSAYIQCDNFWLRVNLELL